jgi:hypothetical protein
VDAVSVLADGKQLLTWYRQANNSGMTEQVHWVGATGKKRDANRTGQSKVEKEAKLSAPPLVERRMLRCPDSLGCSI